MLFYFLLQALLGYKEDACAMLVAGVLLLKFRAAVERGNLTESQRGDLRLEVARVYGEVAQVPVLFDGGDFTRLWQHALGSVDNLPQIMIRSLHCVWKVMLQLCKVTVAKGVGLWIDSQGVLFKLDSPIIRRYLQEHLNKLLAQSKAGKCLTADDLITRKVAMQMLDAFQSPPIMPFVSYTYKVMIALGRFVARLYTTVSFDSCLPDVYLVHPGVVYGVFTTVYACMHCSVIYADNTAESKRSYLQDLVGHGMQQVRQAYA